MTEDNFINYSLFKSRTKFNPLKFFENNRDITYEDFCKYLHTKKVKSPGIEYYNRAIEYVKIKEEPVQVEELPKKRSRRKKKNE